MLVAFSGLTISEKSSISEMILEDVLPAPVRLDFRSTGTQNK